MLTFQGCMVLESSCWRTLCWKWRQTAAMVWWATTVGGAQWPSQGRTRGGTNELQRAEWKIRVTLSWFGLDSPNSLLLSFILQAWRCVQNVSDFRLDRRRTSSDSSYGPKMSSRKAVFWKRIQESTWLQIGTIWTSILFKISKILWFQLLIFLASKEFDSSVYFFMGRKP